MDLRLRARRAPFLPGTSGTSTWCGSRRPGRASAIRPPQRGHTCATVDVAAGRRASTPHASGSPRCSRRRGARRRRGRRRAPTATPAPPRAPRPSTCSRYRDESLVEQRVPISRSASVARRLRTIASSSSGSSSTSGPRRAQRRGHRRARAPAPFQSTPSRSAPRSTSHGLPMRVAPRCSRRQRPVIRRWLRSTSPPSKRSRRFLPTASTDSRRRPFSRSAMPFTAARGCGVSTSSRSPTSGWSRPPPVAARRLRAPTQRSDRLSRADPDGQRSQHCRPSRRTGVPADTLRKWEQRYGVLQPERTEGGQRRYSELDVARVEWLRERLAEGFRISEAAALLGDGDGRRAEDAGRAPPSDLRRGRRDRTSPRWRGLLDQVFTVLPLEQALVRVVEPVLAARRRRVGERRALRRAGAPRQRGDPRARWSGSSQTRAATFAAWRSSRACRASSTSSGCSCSARCCARTVGGRLSRRRRAARGRGRARPAARRDAALPQRHDARARGRPFAARLPTA